MTRLRAADWEVRAHSTPETRKAVMPEARELVERLHYSGGGRQR